MEGEDEIVIDEAMRRRIVNVDETEISLDGSSSRAGGRPAVSFRNPNLPMANRSVSKSSHACTGIFGSTAAGECIPPHWQLPTSATTENEKVRNDFLTHVLDTRGQFGCEEERVWPATIGMNECGGMNDVEFFRYIENVICPLFPDMADVEGSRVVLKVDSGPGRWGRELMLMARFRGLYIYPSVPNATSVQQETDVSYGPFKGIDEKNLERIASACHAAGKSIRVGQSTFGLIVYGGICPMSGVKCRNALEEKFSVSSNLSAWAAVGAVPFTKKCLENPKVRHDGTDERGPNFDVYQDIQSQNDYAVVQLNTMGYRGDVLRAEFLADKVRARSAESTTRTGGGVTVPHTLERQVALSTSNTAGKKFFATGGGSHITTDDMWITMERTRRDGLVQEKEKEKRSRLEANTRRDCWMR